MKIRAIITGATGMVGEGVLHECLLNPDVTSILVINRRPCNIKHKKLTEIIHSNFFDFTAIESKLSCYNAAFLCLGVSSVGMNEEKYYRLTFELTMAFANTLAKYNPGMTICYVSGAGTDSSEKASMMWARVKGKTENHLLKLFPQHAFMFRPGIIQPTKGLRNTYKTYRILSPLFPLLKLLLPKHICSLKQIGIAMINTLNKTPEKQVLEVKDIIKLAQN